MNGGADIPRIEMRDVKKAFGAKRVLEGVDLKVAKGEHDQAPTATALPSASSFELFARQKLCSTFSPFWEKMALEAETVGLELPRSMKSSRPRTAGGLWLPFSRLESS